MTDESPALEAVRFPRHERRGLFLGLQWHQLLILAAGVLTAGVASATAGPAGLLASGPLWLGLILLGLLQYGRIPYPVWTAHLARFLYRTAAGQTRYLARPEQPVPVGRLALPGGLGDLELCRTASGGCVLLDRRGREAMAVLRCSTRSFALLDPEDKAWAVQAWSRVQAGMAQRPGLARIAVQDHTIPYPSTALRDYYDLHAVLDGADDKHLSWGRRAYEDLIAAAGSGMRHHLLATVVVDTAKGRRRIRDAGGGRAGLEHVLRLEVEALTTGLGTHGVTVEEWLPETTLLALIRAAFDPASTHQPQAANTAMTPGGPAVGPMAVEEHWTYLRTDSGVHQTFWVAEWPRQKVLPGFLHPLVYVGDFRHTVTQVIRAVPAGEALRDIRSAQEAHETRRRISARLDRPVTREQRAEEEEVNQREEEIVAGHGDVRPAAYVTITAASLEDLARHRQELESAAAGAFIELRLLAGQQWAAFVAGALPLGRGLR